MQQESLKKAVLWSAFGTVIIFSASVGMALLSSPGHSLVSGFLSDLGVGKRAAWFNYGLIATAIALAVFFISLSLLMKKTITATAGHIAGLAAALGLAGVSVFPENIEPHHSIFAGLFFVLAVFSVFLITIACRQNKISGLLVPATTLAFIILAASLIIFQSPLLQLFSVIAFGAWLVSISQAIQKTSFW